jgi:hypothetical protein
VVHNCAEVAQQIVHEPAGLQMHQIDVAQPVQDLIELVEWLEMAGASSDLRPHGRQAYRVLDRGVPQRIEEPECDLRIVAVDVVPKLPVNGSAPISTRASRAGPPLDSALA